MFISKVSKRCKPFYDILRKNKNFKSTTEHEQEFQEFKNYLSLAPLLAKPEDREPLFLYLVVSKNVVSAILVKAQDGC